METNFGYITINCAAPFMFFDIELPSGRKYSKDIADWVVSTIEDDDVPIFTYLEDDENLTKIGACVGANLHENGVLGRMILLPAFKEYAPNWDMQHAQFTAAFLIDTKFEDEIDFSNLQLEDIEDFKGIYVDIEKPVEEKKSSIIIPQNM